MPSHLSFTAEEMLFAANLVEEFECSDAVIVRQLILDMAISRRFAHGDDDVSFPEMMRPLIKLRMARQAAKAFDGTSKAIH